MTSRDTIVECAVGAFGGSTAAPSGTTFRVTHGGRLLVVADAVGPRARAAGAAQQAIDALVAAVPKIPDVVEKLEPLLRAGFDAANAAAAVDDAARGLAAPEGVALAVIIFSGANVLIGNVGNSRCYRARGSELSVLTRDHSGVAQLQSDARLGKAAHVPSDPFQVHYGGLLSRSLGVGSVTPDITVGSAGDGERYVLCTAGLWSELSDAELREAIVRASSAEDACRRLQNRLRAHAPGHALLVAQLSVHG